MPKDDKLPPVPPETFLVPPPGYYDHYRPKQILQLVGTGFMIGAVHTITEMVAALVQFGIPARLRPPRWMIGMILQRAIHLGISQGFPPMP